MRLISKDDTLKDPSLLTPYSILHFLFGILFALFFTIIRLSFLKGFIIFNIIHLLYEIKDYCGSYTNLLIDYKRIPTKLKTFIKDNSYQNSISDQIIAIIGYLLGYYLLQNNYLTEKNIIHFSIIFIITKIFLIIFRCD
tara:strand:- start:4329 stop:4745 length:417 start_codon:yes stop_codon:yes gene_type:complete